MIIQILDFIRSLTDPEKLIHLLSTVLTGWVGYLFLFLIVFAESGLLVGFFSAGRFSFYLLWASSPASAN